MSPVTKPVGLFNKMKKRIEGRSDKKVSPECLVPPTQITISTEDVKKQAPTFVQGSIPSTIPTQVKLDDDNELLTEIELLNYCIVEASSQQTQRSFMNSVLGDITASSAARQLGIGGLLGWISGFLGKLYGQGAAISVGGSLLLLQIAQHNGYIVVNWTRVQHSLTEAEARLKCAAMRHRQTVFDKAKTFCEENVFLFTGFAAGLCAFLLS